MKLLDIFHRSEKAIVDDEDYERCLKYRWLRQRAQTKHGPEDRYVYCYRPEQLEKRMCYLHRFVLTEEELQSGECVDHINGNPLDNQRSNLRITSYTLNNVNRHRIDHRSQSRIRGVFPYPKNKPYPWRAQITVNDQVIHLGYFETADEAMIARQHAELQYFGELCPLPGREFKEWGGMEC